MLPANAAAMPCAGTNKVQKLERKTKIPTFAKHGALCLNDKPLILFDEVARVTGLEPATFGVTGQKKAE
jgi:hypothetical protein